LQAEERHKTILDYLKQVEFASLEDLSTRLDVSVSTVRRDVTNLEGTGKVKRTHGGARLVNPESDEFAFATRDVHQFNEKEAIGRAVANLIEPNQTVIMDAGSTVFHVAKYLEPKTPHIVTNSLPVANHYAANHQVEVIVSGGVIYPRLGVMVGPLAIHAFSEINADVAVMGAGGITEDGISNSHVLLIDIQLQMLKAARKVIFCVDHTKIGRQSLTRLCGFDQIDTIVTDAGAPDELIAQIRAKGVEVIIG
jgi:DeoR family transcriptional regulator, fructose operon transcriptional repressor